MVAVAAYAPSTYSPTVVVGPLTLDQLVTQYTSANIVGIPAPFATSDAGLQTWNGSAWVGGLAYPLFQSGIDAIFPPPGTMSNNGAFTFSGGVVLDAVYANAYIYMQPGQIFAGSTPGWYYCVMSSTSAGTVYNNPYRFGQPTIPVGGGTPFVCTGPGAWTALTNTAISGYTFNMPAFAMGINGRIDVKLSWSASNSSDDKGIAISYGGSGLGGTDYQTTALNFTTQRTMVNRGQTGAQVCNGTTGTGSLIGNSYITIDSTAAQSIWLYFNILTGTTNWIVLHYMQGVLTPAGLLDTPLLPSMTPANPGIVPPGAAALGYTNNVWFINPTLAMVSVGGSTPLQTTASLAHYSNATVNGVNYLSINQLGDGVNTACSTNTPSTLASLPSASGWYFEAAVTLTNNGTDHWQSVYFNPTEKNAGGTVPYVEVDGMEQIGARGANDPFYGNTTSVIDWGSGSGSPSTSDTTNLSPPYFGPNIDWTKEHIFGTSYDPVGEIIAFWIDGIKMPLSISTSSFNGNIATLHYFIVLQAASHTSGAGGTPYSMLVRYFSAWN
jgi:hypothetical protein